jgi:hypothetical protein
VPSPTKVNIKPTDDGAYAAIPEEYKALQDVLSICNLEATINSVQQRYTSGHPKPYLISEPTETIQVLKE